MRTRPLDLAVGLAVLLGVPALAVTVTSSLQVSATVAPSCGVTANNLLFGSYDSTSSTPSPLASPYPWAAMPTRSR